MDLGQTPEITEDVNKDDSEKDAPEQINQNSEQTPVGNEAQDVYKNDPEKDSQEQKDVQDVNKDDSAQGSEKIDQMEKGNVQNIVLSRQEVNSLRKDVQKWLELHQSFGRDDVCLAIKELVDLRQKYNTPPLLWQKEVISLRDVQERLNWIIEYMKITPEKNKEKNFLGRSQKSLDLVQIPRQPSIRKLEK